MTIDDILIIVITVLVAIVLTYLFFRIAFPIIVFLAFVAVVYYLITNWNDRRKYQY